MLLNRDDVVRIAESVVRELRLELCQDGERDKKIVLLKYRDQVIDKMSVDLNNNSND
jgi:hypothetical protein